jgi:hypothetical protein
MAQKPKSQKAKKPKNQKAKKPPKSLKSLKAKRAKKAKKTLKAAEDCLCYSIVQPVACTCKNYKCKDYTSVKIIIITIYIFFGTCTSKQKS